jgi:hypothetical protein
LLRARPRECGKALLGRVERHRQAPEVPGAEEIRLRFCSSEVDVFGSPTKVFALEGFQATIAVAEAARIQFPSWADSNSPAFWSDGMISVFNSSPEGAYVARGESVENLGAPLPVDIQPLERPGRAWLEAVWRDPETALLYGWYHFEPEDLPCYPLTAPVIGAAVSEDGGITWLDRGFVIENAHEFDCDYENGYFVGGSGDFSVVAGTAGDYFYFVYTNYVGDAGEVGVAMARSAYEDRGQPGSVWNYYLGAWEEPGLGGPKTALFPSSTGWRGPHVESYWGPSVHWNRTLQAYVALLNHTDGTSWEQEGIYIAVSQDMENWTRPQKLFDSTDWYPQVMGLGLGGTDSNAGRFLRFYIGGISTFVLEFVRGM